MKEIKVSASDEYSVFVAPGMLKLLGEYAAEAVPGRKAMLVCGREVYALYADEARKSLLKSDFAVNVFVYASGEENKKLTTVEAILEAAAEAELTSEDCFVALGGGVTGDITGLAAALYKRGTACIQVPTTLLAAVDSSVGGKTAVNLRAGKNLAGIIKQPALVLCDTDCLSTLPKRILNEGRAEIIKYAVLDGDIYELVSKEAGTEEIISACLEYKSRIVAVDEKDRGLRRLLNFGHTIGHAIEWCSGYELLHGEAVAAGMSIMTRGCERLGICEEGSTEILTGLLSRYELPLSCGMSARQLMDAAHGDKKRKADKIALVLPERIGRCRIEECGFDMLERIIYAGL